MVAGPGSLRATRAMSATAQTDLGSGAASRGPSLALPRPRVAAIVLVAAIFSTPLGCSSNSTGPGMWTILVSNQSDSATNVTAWNEANPGQIAQFNTVTVSTNGSGCLRLDPTTWGTTTAALQTNVWVNNAVPPQWVQVLSDVTLSEHGQWSWTITAIPPFQTTPAPTSWPC